ncbi:hypothetical protein HDU93_005881 [Gonapodya sp. JEL0774]|nr:hypothetical protein HDU93_005881 [Gonapodya sp. JEL0774]
MTRQPLSIVSILGSVRDGRLGIKVAEYINRVASKNGKHAIDVLAMQIHVTLKCAPGHNLTFIDCAKPEWDLPMLRKRFMDYGPNEQIPTSLTTLHKLFSEADAFILITPEYNQNAAPALTNMLDHFLPEFNKKVAGIASYSISFGAARIGGSALRPMCAQLGMVATPLSLTWPSLTSTSFDESGTPKDQMSIQSVAAFVQELEFYGLAIKNAREEQGKL